MYLGQIQEDVVSSGDYSSPPGNGGSPVVCSTMDIPEIDPNFEPQARARSNTWPLRPKEATKEEDPRSTGTSPGSNEVDDQALKVDTSSPPPPTSAAKKGTARRNAWGNLSYADLITKGIQSSPEGRMTLSQIYDWMVHNVPYFKDKGDSNSSAGWKNSIRHNLSLHNRFMRVQNEGTGKSSWWVINPDAKPGKSPRRRATSMDTKSYEKKRGRVKKKVEQLRAQEAARAGSTSNINESNSELLPDSFQDFRARTSSNASSIGGRLSPLRSIMEPDLHDNQVPPQMSPLPWSSPLSDSGLQGMGDETLSDSLAGMFVGENINNFSPGTNIELSVGGALSTTSLSSNSPHQLSPSGNFVQQSPQQDGMLHPTYGDGQMIRSPQQHRQQHSPHSQPSPNSLAANGVVNISRSVGSGSFNNGLNTIAAQLESSSGSFLSQLGEMPNNHFFTQPDVAMTRANVSESNMDIGVMSQYGNFQVPQQHQALRPQVSPNFNAMPHAQIGLSSSLLRQALTAKVERNQQLLQQQRQQVNNLAGGGILQPAQISSLQHLLTSDSDNESLQQNLALQQQQQQQPNQIYHNPNPQVGQQETMPQDIDFALCADQEGELECDMDQIIKQELSLDGNLDFNFESNMQTGDNGQQQFGTIQT